MRALFVISLMFILSCCATSQIPTLSSAKMRYDHGDYVHAYEELVDLAKLGDVESQYAVGYMKYYGLGTSRDENEARGWIRRAARRGHPDATAALLMLSEDSFDPRVDPLPDRQFNHTNQRTAKRYLSQRNAQKRSSLAWLRQQNPKHYTLDLTDQDFTKVIMQAMQKRTPKVAAAKYSALDKGHRREHVMLGSFKDKASAEDAYRALAPPMRAKVQVLSMANIQKRMLP